MGRTSSLPVGITVRKNTHTESIQIAFSYHGVACREALRIEATEKNIRYAERLRGTILSEIEKGTFDYGKHFPDSPKAAFFGGTQRSSRTVKALIEEWLIQCRRSLAHSTMCGYDAAIAAHYEKLLPIPIRDVTPKFLRKWLGDLGISRKRMANILTPLRGAVALALQDGDISVDPLGTINIARLAGNVRKRPRYVVNPFSLNEIRVFLAAARQPFRFGLQLAFFTGLRTSELIALEWEQVDMTNWTITIDRVVAEGREKDSTKTEAGMRVIELIGPAREAITSLRRVAPKDARYVVLKPGLKSRYANSDNWGCAFTRTLRRTELPYRNPYQTRHTFASMLLSQGENVLWVSRQLGHATAEITLRKYARWIPGNSAGYQPVSAVASMASLTTDQDADRVAA